VADRVPEEPMLSTTFGVGSHGALSHYRIYNIRGIDIEYG